MKKILIILGSIFLAIVVLIAIGIGFVTIRGTALDKESKAYADAAIPAIITNWSEKELFVNPIVSLPGAPDSILQFTTPEFAALLNKEWAYSKGGVGHGLRPLAWSPGRRNRQAGSLLRRNGVDGYGRCCQVISVRA